MDKVFGIPIDQLLVQLLIIFGIGVAIIGVVALRNRVMLKMALRNIPRRGRQSALIVVGLMLATVPFSAALATGDTLTNSIRVLVVRHLGEVDIIVQSESPEVSGRSAYFDQSYLETVRQALADDPEVEGVAPLVSESAPVVAPATRLSEPDVTVLGMAMEWMDGFNRLADVQGNTLSLGVLAPNQAYISSELANELDVGPGDTVQVYLGPQPDSLEVAGIYQKGGNPAGKLSLVMPMERMQTLVGKDGQIAAIIITNRGNSIQGAKHSDAVVGTLEPVLEGSGLEGRPCEAGRPGGGRGEWHRDIHSLLRVRAVLHRCGHPPHFPHLRYAGRRAEKGAWCSPGRGHPAGPGYTNVHLRGSRLRHHRRRCRQSAGRGSGIGDGPSHGSRFWRR